VRRGAPIPW